jgi:hypothetical protein
MMPEETPPFSMPEDEQQGQNQPDPLQESPDLNDATKRVDQIPVEDNRTGDIEQAHLEALVEDASREARGGMLLESAWAGYTVSSLREDLQTQLDFTKAHPETVNLLMAAAKADAFDKITIELNRFTHDDSRMPERGKIPLLGARNAAEEARRQTRENDIEAWKILQKGLGVYNRSLAFGLQEVATGHAERPFRTKSTGPGRNDHEIIGYEYDGPHVRAVIDNFQAEQVQTT